MGKWGGLCFDEAKWPVVYVPMAVSLVVTGVMIWSMATNDPQQRDLHLDDWGDGSDQTMSTSTLRSAIDCDICVAVHTGDDGSSAPSKTNLPFNLVRRLFLDAIKIKVSAQREKIVCVGVDHTDIPCRMARDEFGVNVNCWDFEHMRMQMPTPVRCDHIVVGKTNRYLSQLAMFEKQTSGNFTWQQLHVVELDATPTHSQAPALKQVRPTIVTAFSGNHLTVGLLLLRSIAKASLEAQKTKPEFAVAVVVWQMDELRGRDKDDLECVVREMKTLGIDVDVRRFKFWEFPKWMRIEQSQETGSFNEDGVGGYAWKVIMIHTVLVERGFVLWTDAGGRFKTTESLTASLDYIAEHGFASRRSAHDIGKWTVQEALLYLRATHLDRHSPNCDASSVGFTLKKYEELAGPWYECAITRQCIAPDGSSRRNHRQDQAALTVLSYLTGNECTGLHGDFEHHMDYNLRDTTGAAPSSCYSDPRK